MKILVAAMLASLWAIAISLVCYPIRGEAHVFTPEDDVGLALFEYAGRGAPGGIVKFSPDGRYFVVLTERGRLDLNAPEDTLWLFRTRDVQDFLRRRNGGPAPAPLPLAQSSSDRNGPLIEDVKWLPDSTGVAFTTLKKDSRCKYHQLALADVKTHTIRALTPEEQDVTGFDIRSNRSYVYTVKAPQLLIPGPPGQHPAVASTGENFWAVAFPDAIPDDHALMTPFAADGLWAVVDGVRRQVLRAESYETSENGMPLALSPDGHWLVTVLKTEHPPESWSKYKAPPGYEKMRLPLDPSSYYLIDLRTGARKILVNAPWGLNQDWHSYLQTARWSADGQSLILTDVFFPLDVKDPLEISDRESHPYIAVLRLKSGKLSKVLAVRAGLDKLRYAIKDVHFEGKHTVVVDFDRSHYLPKQPPAAVFREQTPGHWEQVAGDEDPRVLARSVIVSERESINQPPQLVGRDKTGGGERVIWDPNPQLKQVELGSAEVIRWKDDTGYEWEGGLVEPPGYIPGKLYPLVIQTHGFSESQFLTNGIFTSAFAARALAAHGIVVLQMGWNVKDLDTPSEGPGVVAGFRSVVKKLADEGMIDPARVGAIGFSRSVYHVLYAATADPRLLAAASVTDGVDFGYFEYIMSVDTGFAREADLINGGSPMRSGGMRRWLEHSPEFNVDKVAAPVLFLQPGIISATWNWGVYAGLRYLKKPVDLIVLQPGTHVMTNPRQRLASEISNVDWFDFWLNGHEDSNPSKAEQYRRWKKLCDMQIAENPGRPTWCVPTRDFRNRDSKGVRPMGN